MNSKHRTVSLATIEWQTVALILTTYSIWAALLFYAEHIPLALWVMGSAVNIALFMSITHEVVHGHPTRNARMNRLLILLPIGWSIPYERFRQTHLDHHTTEELTDPFDDPESWYLSHSEWMKRSRFAQWVFAFNNTLLGRMMIGPVISLTRFYASEIRYVLHRRGHWVAYIKAWAIHFVLCGVMVALILEFSEVSVWQWLLSIYLGHSILLIRTFLEHQAAPDHSQRTVIIEAPCPLAFLFLFNNYHFVHHDRPHVPWYQLPREYREKRVQFLAQNNSYVYRSYFEVFQKFFLRSKEPVPHPFLRSS